MLNFIFFDESKEILADFEEGIGADKQTFFTPGTVEEITEKYNIHVIISPTDCYGSIDRSLDLAFNDLFPNIGNRIKDQIERFKLETTKGDLILPIGSSILVPTRSKETPLLLCTSLTTTPDDREIVDTYNVYWAFRSILMVLDKMPSDIVLNVACPCFGTCCMRETIDQIAAARHDFQMGNTSFCDPQLIDDVEIISRSEEWAHVISNHACLPIKN